MLMVYATFPITPQLSVRRMRAAGIRCRTSTRGIRGLFASWQPAQRCLNTSSPETAAKTDAPRTAARKYTLIMCRFLFIVAAGLGVLHAQDARCAGSRDLRLTNGKIMTLDRQNTVVSEVIIQNGRFTAVGRNGDTRTSPCTRTVNLRGRTVTPGLIDNHNHMVLLGIRPGHDTRLE